MFDRLHPFLGLVALALAAALVGCEESNDGEEIEPPPIAVSSSTPGQLAPTDAGLDAVAIVLNRSAEGGQMFSAMFPSPPGPGRFEATSASNRNWGWVDLQLDIADGGYHVLIDGAEMISPFVLSFSVDPLRSADVGLGGKVDTPDFEVVDPVEAAVFALRLNTLFNPSEPQSWIEAWANGDILAATSLQDDNASVDEALRYRLTFLEPERRYFVVAIADTNGDLTYDPRDDWWAISRNEDGVFAGFVTGRFGGPKGENGEEVDLFLRAPATID